MLTLLQTQDHLAQATQLTEQGKYNEAIILLEQIAPILAIYKEWKIYVQCLNNHSKYLWQSGKYNEGITKATIALQVCLDNWGEQSIDTAKCYCNLGICHRNKGDYAQAIAYLQQALSIQLAVLGEKHPDSADSYNHLGVCYKEKGDYTQAIAYQQQALAIYLVVLGEQHADTANSYNNLGVCYKEKGGYTQAIAYYQQALTIRLAVLGEKHLHTAMSYNNLGNCYKNKGDYSQAIAYTQQALAIRLAVLGEKHPHTAGSYGNLGACYLYKGDYAQAIVYFQQVLSIFGVTLGEQHPNTAKNYNNLGVCYEHKGDYTQAIAYHEQALAIWLAILGEKHPDIAASYNNLGSCYRNKGNYNQAIAYHQQALTIWLAVLGEQHPNMAKNYNNLGVCYEHKGNYTQAIAYYEQALAIRLAVLGEKHPDTANSYNGLGVCCWHKGDYTQAIAYHRQGLSIRLAALGKHHPDIAASYNNLGICYWYRKDYTLALQHYQYALKSLALNVPKDDYYPLPKIEGYNSAVKLLEILLSKAGTFLTIYSIAQSFKDLAAALAHYQYIDQLVDQMRQSYKTEGSKLTLAEKCKAKVYDAGLATIWIAEQLYDLNPVDYPILINQFNKSLHYHLPDRPIDLAFHLSEKSKAVLLFAGIKDAEARVNAQLPPDLVQQEYNLRIELTYLERRISEEGYKKPEEQDQTTLSEWRNQHFDVKNKYNALIERLETEFPKYYQLKYDIHAATIAQVQVALPLQKAMISYVLAEKYLYLLIITAQNSTWLQTELPTDFEDLVEDFLFSFQSIGKRDYVTYGYYLYRQLILPAVNTGVLHGIQQLIIIPDGMLSRLPFEALLTATCSDNIPDQKLPYLLHQYQITYHYSATLWLNQQNNATQTLPDKGIQDFIGFAPVYRISAQNNGKHDIPLDLPNDFYEKIGIEKPEEDHRIGYPEMPETVRSLMEGRNFVELAYSETEVRNVGELFAAQRQTAKVLLHEKATLDNFKALASQYRYVLIAAHADYNDKKPDQTGIIFSPNETDGNGIFYMGDAYNLPLQANLVVLSCCETGLGKISKGEGTMALNRGFLYSGAKNVVYTLFKVYDKQSCELTTELFRQLIAQQPSIEALHQAKLNLIARGLMPNKWAGYILVGQ